MEEVRIKKYSFLIFFLPLLWSCEPAEHNFTAEELKLVDSLYNTQKDSVEALMKEQCDSIFIEVYDGIVDSMKEVRRKEILDIIGE